MPAGHLPCKPAALDALVSPPSSSGVVARHATSKVAMSIAEAEYAAASQTCREMTYIRNVCGDLGLVLRGRLCLAVDNTAAIAICENPGVTARNKHFSDAVHYVRHEYDHGRIRLVFVTTDKQRADGFTKPLESAAFYKWRRHIISAHPPV